MPASFSISIFASVNPQGYALDFAKVSTGFERKIRQPLAKRKRRIERRLDRTKCDGDCLMISAGNIHYELADRTRAVSTGGIGLMQQLVKQLELDQAINRHAPVFKFYLPYSESDHVLIDG